MTAPLARTRRTAPALLGSLGLLLVAGCLLCSVARAVPARSTVHSARAGSRTGPTVVADSRFRPQRDGYAFPNYGAEPGLPDLGSAEMIQLFGNGVCAGFTGGACVLSPPALAWMQEENDAMADGHCVGFSVTALFFYAHLSTPSPFGAPVVPRLRIADNELLAREIAYGYVFQALDSVRNAEVAGSPREVLARLTSALRTGSELYTLAVTQPDGEGGHAVTPYEIERLAPDRYAILVYDNNYPGQTRMVLVNTNSDTWSFNAAPTPDQPGSEYTGDAGTRSLFLLPTRPGLGVQPCPFCSIAPAAPTTAAPTTAPPATAPPTTAAPTTAAPTTATATNPSEATTATATNPAAVAASFGAAPYEAIRLQTTGPVTGHLLITDLRGRQVGFVHGRLVDQIPGARIISLFVGGTQTWLDSTEPEYEVPSGQSYRIMLTGEATAGTRPTSRTADSSQASVTVLEPGFIAAVHGVHIDPGRRYQLDLRADGHAISFLARSAGRQAPELVLGNATTGENDYEWNITSLGTPAGRQISASLNLAEQSMSLSGSGSYDLSMDMAGNGVSVFAHSDVVVGAGVTAGFDYANWAAGDAMPMTDTKDRTVVSQQELSDGPDPSDTGSEFYRTESTPAPAEPQPNPISPGLTATMLVCSPGTVPVGYPTTCDVHVSDLDSDSPGQPTGEIDFSSDQSGLFSDDSCTLANGSCEVTYTPTAPGPGTHGLTASYGGDHTYHPSDETITVDVFASAADTDTSLACDPGEVPVGQSTTCTATVTDSGPGTASTPTGEVDFSSTESGLFSDDSCTLANGSCEVTYTPTAAGPGTHDLTASFKGDQSHDPSDDTTAVKVDLRATDISLACDPGEVSVGQSTTCTATVTDSGPGTASTPTGVVTFVSSSPGVLNGSPCTLIPVNGAGADCAVTYTPAFHDGSAACISARYVGDSTHVGSNTQTAGRCCRSTSRRGRVIVYPHGRRSDRAHH